MMTRSYFLFVIVSLMLLAVSANAAHYAGGVVSLIFDKQSDELPVVRYGLAEPTLIDHNTHWEVLVGIELNTLPGDYLVFVDPKNDETPFVLNFSVLPRAFPELKDKLPISIIHKEFSVLDYTNSQQPSLPLNYPTQGTWHNAFGHIEDANSKKLRQRNYISFSTTKLITVESPQNGIVSRIIQEESGLSTVFIDHGRGLYSVLGGLSDLSVEEGNGINQGAVIGKLPSGQSNVIPSRLTWQCILNGVYIDPETLVNQP